MVKIPPPKTKTMLPRRKMTKNTFDDLGGVLRSVQLLPLRTRNVLKLPRSLPLVRSNDEESSARETLHRRITIPSLPFCLRLTSPRSRLLSRGQKLSSTSRQLRNPFLAEKNNDRSFDNSSRMQCSVGAGAVCTCMGYRELAKRLQFIRS